MFSCNSGEKQSEKPNIVFIFADDLSYNAIHGTGNEEIKTPNIDRLIQNGTTFSNAYNMGGWNGAVCLASRAMIMSGRTVWNANAFRQNWINKDSTSISQTWGKIMEANGYDTYMTGKWHIDIEPGQVFQEVSHIRPGMPADEWAGSNMGQKFKDWRQSEDMPLSEIMPVGYHRPMHENDQNWSPSSPEFGGYWEGGQHWSEVLKDDALNFVSKASSKPNPFFMYLAFNAPHDPRQSPQSFIDQYPLENISLPESWISEYPYKDDIGCGPSLRDEALAPFPRTEYATKKHIQEYYAIITHLDEQIGMILNELEASGRMENTYIIFTADHGLAMGHHGLLGKQNMFDHSMRVPMIISGPDIPKGKMNNADVYLQDVMPTSLELADIDKPDYVEFQSFVDLAKNGQNKSHYSSIYGAYINLQRMIRKDGFKLIVYPKISKILLFDLEKDPGEMNDLSGLPTYQNTLMELMKELIDSQKDLNDELSMTNLFNEIMVD